MYFCNVIIILVCIIGVYCGNSLTVKNPNRFNRKPHPVVMGGYVATMEEFPYAIRLYIIRHRLLIFCTGQAVHRRLVMTAAHCVSNGGQMIVVTGESDHEDYVHARNLHKYARYKIIDVFVHPHFMRDQYTNDIALIKTGREMMHRGLAVIAISYVPLKKTVEGKIFGWGGTELARKNNQLYGKYTSVSNCTLAHHTYKYVCMLEKGICHGDSGGGMILNNSIIGVASFYQKPSPKRCEVADLYYYTALSEVQEFVENCIRRNGSNSSHSCWWLVIEFLILHYILK